MVKMFKKNYFFILPLTSPFLSFECNNVLNTNVLDTFNILTLFHLRWTSAIADSLLDDLAPSFPINRHIAFALGATLEMATYTFVYFVLTRYGRRLPMCTYQSLNGIVCILIAIFFILTTPTTPWIGT